jgi:hypothetical protein
VWGPNLDHSRHFMAIEANNERGDFYA